MACVAIQVVPPSGCGVKVFNNSLFTLVAGDVG